MAYIGRQPEIGNFQMCDAISVVNGQASYTMQVAGINVIPGGEFNVICSLNGVIQQAGTSFTISSSTITFSQNLVTGDVIDFILILGSVLDLGVPSDGTVTSSKLATNISIAGTLDVDEILTTSNANLKLAPNGQGLVEIKGDGSSISGKIQLNCDNNTHGVAIQSPPHASQQSYTLTLPTTAPQNNKVLGVDSSGQLSFTDASIPAPTVTSVSPVAIPDSADTAITITGTGFTDNPQVQFINSSGVITNAATVSYTNSTTIAATSGSLADAAYFIRVENTNGTAGQSGSAILNASGVVTWSTASGSIGAVAKGGSTSFSVLASSDSAVTYSILSGALPSGYSLNTSTGAITGTENSSIGSSTTYNFTIRGTDVETQTADRAFSLTVTVTASVEYLVVGAGAGGGAGQNAVGGQPNGGGGGGGGIITGTLTMTPSTDTSTVTVGGGGSSGGNSGGTGGAGGLSKFVFSGNSTTYQAGGAPGSVGRGGGNSGSPQSRSAGGNSSTYGGGGGGGAGGNGGTASGSHGYGQAAGGAGLYYANFQQFGYNGYFGAGGSGAYNGANSTGGAGADSSPLAGSYGAGGGAGTGGGTAGTGAGGCVIFRYSGSAVFTGGTITTTGGYTYHVFSSSGTFA
mgnify:FL=1